MRFAYNHLVNVLENPGFSGSHATVPRGNMHPSEHLRMTAAGNVWTATTSGLFGGQHNLKDGPYCMFFHVHLYGGTSPQHNQA
jgi:hypothetical protein